MGKYERSAGDKPNNRGEEFYKQESDKNGERTARLQRINQMARWLAVEGPKGRSALTDETKNNFGLVLQQHFRLMKPQQKDNWNASYDLVHLGSFEYNLDHNPEAVDQEFRDQHGQFTNMHLEVYPFGEKIKEMAALFPRGSKVLGRIDVCSYNKVAGEDHIDYGVNHLCCLAVDSGGRFYFLEQVSSNRGEIFMPWQEPTDERLQEFTNLLQLFLNEREKGTWDY